MAAVVVLLDSVDSAAAALLVPVVPVPAALLVPVVPVAVLHEPQLPALAPPVLLQVPPEPLLLHLLSTPSRQVVVESGVPLRRQGRQSFSAAMARVSPPTGKPTCERAPSTR